jgi:hypothetical protein
VVQADLAMKDLFAALLDGNEDALSRHAQYLPLLHASPALVQALQRVSLCGARQRCH